ncbi:hypothetical protein AUJ13_01885 [Candidatus Micrarchaeota archaeon CG1_02_49_24]|nr:MAG: hypothetical protein AUJ13_01885 [Candidatus Micrarchaeota archaeon CG1_02_49_24]
MKLAEYPALRAGMNAKRQLHENSRTTALEIFGKSSRTLRAIFQLARFNRYQAKTGFPNEPSYPAHCAGSLASAREALRKI